MSSSTSSPSSSKQSQGRSGLQSSLDGRQSLQSSQEHASRKPVNLVSLSNFFLIALPDKLVLQIPKETTSLSISDSGDVNATSLKLEMITTPVYGETTLARRVFAVLGVIRLALGRHLVVVTDRELCGTVAGRTVWKATAVEMIPIPAQLMSGSPEQVKANDMHLSNLKQFLRDALFYFSYEFSLTMSQQSLDGLMNQHDAPSTPRSGNDSLDGGGDTAVSAPSKSSSPALAFQWECSEERFFWNVNIAVPFCREGFGRYVVAVIDGFFKSNVLHMNGTTLRLTLISRRSRHRAGTRFLTRGIDPQGHVANFVETEQVLELVEQGVVYSWVTVRGSIPVFWSQLGAERIPRPVVQHSPLAADAFRNHIAQLRTCYGTGLTLVNLIDQTGKEAALGDAYETFVRLYGGSDIRYVAVDFHELTKGDRYENLSQLMDVLADDVTAEVWFSSTPQGRSSLQRAVARVNCVDCLDRTNVVQAMMAKFVLHHQLYLNRLMDPGSELPSDFVDMFNSMWTDNADAISFRYTGAAAMKTNFTRTGVHGLRGQLQDGFTAAERFVEQMLRDPAKQDAINLFVGKYASRRIGGLSPNAAADGIMRVKAYKKSTWKLSVEYPVAFEINRKDIILFDWDSQKLRVFSIDSLVALNPSVEEGAVLSLSFSTCVNPKVLRFQSPVVRQRMITRLLQLAPRLSAKGSTVSVFVGSIDMMDCGVITGSFSDWLPENFDLYVISCANAIFPSPADCVFFGVQYLFYQLLSHLGAEKYESCFSSESATGDGMLIICRSAIRHRVAGIESLPITRTIKTSDPDWLKRAQYASNAHREVSKSKSQARIDTLGSPHLRTPRRRGTVDIQKEVTQSGLTVSLCIDGGPPLLFVHAWDPLSPAPLPSKCESFITVVTGQLNTTNREVSVLVSEESRLIGTLGPLVGLNLRETKGFACQLECQGPIVSETDSSTTQSAQASMVSEVAVDGESVVAEVGSAAGSQDTLSKFRDSLKNAPVVPAGVVRVSAVASSDVVQIELGPSKTCTGLGAKFVFETLSIEPVILEPPGSLVLELRDVKVFEWTVKVAPTKLRLEFDSALINDEPVTSSMSENGVWQGPITLVPWTIDSLPARPIKVNMTGFASSTSSFGGFLSTITGTASSLGVGRLPAAPGPFRISLYTVQQDVVQDTIIATMEGLLELKEKKIKK